MKKRNWFLIFALFCSSLVNPGYADNSHLILSFGGSPGEKLPHPYDYGVPHDATDSYTMRIPMTKPDLAAVFYDTVLTVTAPDKIVRRVEASRAYKSIRECNEALAVVEEKLVAALPKPYTGNAGAWTYWSADGKAAGAVTCTKGSKRPFTVLRLVIAEPQ